MLTHSIVSLGAVVLLTLVFAAIQLAFPLSHLDSEKAFQTSLMFNVVVASFLGIYLGGALLSLKTNYLWRINQHYRNCLIGAYLIIIILFNLVQVPLLAMNLNASVTVLFAPFCITIFASQMVLGKNAFLKIIIPTIPYLILQLYRIEVDISIIMSLIIVATMVLLTSLYSNRYYPANLSRKRSKDNLPMTTSAIATGIQPSLVSSFNHYVGLIAADSIRRSKKNIDWAILMPHTKLAMGAIFYVLLITGFLLVVGDKDKSMSEAFSILFVSVSLISIVIESRHLLRQTRLFAHVFTGKDHQQLKSKILFSLDKTFVVNSMVFVVSIWLVSHFLAMPLNTSSLLFSVLAIVLIGLAVYPTLLCISWINISFAQVFSICAYGGLIFITMRWLTGHSETVLVETNSYLFLLGCLIVRSISQSIFWKRPIENLYKNK